MIRILTNPSLFVKYLTALLIVLCSGCASNQMERNFFEIEYDQAGSRFESYSIPDQIKIYLYGVQSVTPPATVLSRQIAEHGKEAIPAIMNELNTNPTEENIKDLMVVFETMQRIGTYDVSNDKRLLRTLDNYVDNMKNKIWQGYTKINLYKIKTSNQEAD